MNESLIVFIIKTLSVVFRILPLPVALFLGRKIGSMGYYFGGKHARVALNNLRVAFASKRTPDEIRQILKKFYQTFGQNVVELLRFPKMYKQGLDRYVTFKDRANLDQALAGGKGVILLAVHAGNWELANIYGSTKVPVPYNMVANPLRETNRVDDLLNEYRTMAGCKIINPGIGSREIIKRLKKNEIVILVVDQGGKDGTLVDFFGRQAAMSTGAVRIARHLGSAICPVYIHREGAHHILEMSKPLWIKEVGDEDKDIEWTLREVVRYFEQKIEEHPHEYMWFYKIWKYAKEATVLTLDDGRTGHLRQSQALGCILDKELARRNISATYKTVPVIYKNEIASVSMSLLGVLSQYLPVLRRLEYLKWFLTPESFKAVTSIKPDYVISCGSGSAAVNFWCAKVQNARNIAIMRPGMMSSRGFYLVVLPQHDAVKPLPQDTESSHTVVTRVAPNLVNKGYIDQQAQLLVARYSHLKNSYKMRIGLLIGGDTKGVVMEENAMRSMAHQLSELAEQLNAEFLVTTSRRTSPEIEQLLYRELKKSERCPLFIMPSKNPINEAIGGILGLADLVIVSGESISMISEAINSGKRTIVFTLWKSTDTMKYARFVDRLHDQGYIVASDPKNIGQAVYTMVKNKIYPKPIDDDALLSAGVRKIIF